MLAVACWVIVLWPMFPLAETNNAAISAYRDVFMCGPNSLFMLLILSGHADVTLERLKNIPMDLEGTSLLNLRDAAREFHMETEIRHYQPQDVDPVPLPAIVQFKSYGSSITAHHFNLLYKVDARRAYMIDGTSGVGISCARSRLPDWWTGYALIEKRPVSLFTRNGNLGQLVGCLIAFDLIVLSVLRLWSKRTQIPPVRVYFLKGELQV